MNKNQLAVFCVFVATCASSSAAEDWIRFRGRGGLGISNSKLTPTTWSESANLKWKTELPGAGSSSPIVKGDRVYVTCYSGYAQDKSDVGRQEDLKRHLVCVDRASGDIVWSKSVDAVLPEDPYRGFIQEHGYASGTPTIDDEQIYVFFGKSGVLAFDLAGNQKWQVSVGTESSKMRWGSGASLILYKDTVIVNAAEEGRAIIALDKKTGKKVWKAEGGSLELAFNTPTLVDLEDGEQELVVAVPSEIWALHPDTGKLKWYADTHLAGNVSPTVTAKDGILYAFGGFISSGSIAIRAGGKGDVTDTHVIWTSRESSYVATPLLHDGHFYWIDDRGLAFCQNAKTGERVYRERVVGDGNGLGGGRPFYASPVLIGDKLICVSRIAGTFVIAAQPEYKELGQNRIAGDESDFNGTPAISNNQMFLRSNKFLYCIGE